MSAAQLVHLPERRLLQNDLCERDLTRPFQARAHVAQQIHHRKGLAASVSVVDARNDFALERDNDPVYEPIK